LVHLAVWLGAKALFKARPGSRRGRSVVECAAWRPEIRANVTHASGLKTGKTPPPSERAIEVRRAAILPRNGAEFALKLA
jgi:hypothetical protein